MKTLGDVVLEQAKLYPCIGTGKALELLGLKDVAQNFAAANMYAVALSVIAKLLKEKENANHPDTVEW